MVITVFMHRQINSIIVVKTLGFYSFVVSQLPTAILLTISLNKDGTDIAFGLVAYFNVFNFINAQVNNHWMLLS